ncbi:hypothetical protein B0H63DRAFT_319849 [Podospora didyma]|uniref:Uncharacterized protein n=1 Tax=Podospora didyma TaxID=330526 RepID=A0AAE0K6W3_9PEZI|nr:hypothetical protein B0H63DRAFT_319849 [Podospora didyma]
MATHGRPAHNGRQHGASSKAAKSNSNRAPTGSKSMTSNVNFLFIVNEFQVDFEPAAGGFQVDQWRNPMPPMASAAYRGETVGAVFRYHNGTISRAPDYLWYRREPTQGGHGGIMGRDQQGNYQFLEVYKTQSIFACSAHLPIIVSNCDASVVSDRDVTRRTNSSAFMQRGCDCDSAYDGYYPWSLLNFSASAAAPGVSFARLDAEGVPFVVGKNPSWIPSLVPGVFRNTRNDHGIPRSQGLSGELPIVIALMAFHSRANRASDVFDPAERRWHRGAWDGPNTAPAGYPLSENNPRGFLVQVCIDRFEDGSAEPIDPINDPAYQAIYNLEWYGILVRDGLA